MITLDTSQFCWATGIEDSFIPQARPGLRAMDEYELTQHYSQWQTDIDRAAEAGVQAMRWGVPWYRVQPGPETWDWRWTDAVLEYMVVQKGITPILDLMHYGTPLWLDNSFINASYTERVAEYAIAVLERYTSLVRLYTPMNEPVINAQYCGQRGEWPPYLSGDDGFVKVLAACARGIVHTVRALQIARPELVSVQVEALWHNWFQGNDPGLQARVEQNNARQFLSFDLCTGRVDENYPLYSYLREHGFTDADFTWFRENRVRFDVFGANYYPWSHGALVQRKGGHGLYRLRAPTPGATLAERLVEAHQRYQMPVMVTETSARASVRGRGRWMDETIRVARELRAAGLPLVGYTWFPLFSMFNWDYRRGRMPLNHYTIHLGLYDCDFDAEGVFRREETPLVERFRRHIAQRMLPVPAADSPDLDAFGDCTHLFG
ncbi:MAG: family 1 glycosylhydrolase [Anaerolineaceae bacterium]|nr:family 1 glycosylhydrolase [Anaerolineaceae bacterium]